MSLKKIGIDLKSNQRVSEHDERSKDSERTYDKKKMQIIEEDNFKKIQLKEKAD